MTTSLESPFVIIITVSVFFLCEQSDKHVYMSCSSVCVCVTVQRLLKGGQC